MEGNKIGKNSVILVKKASQKISHKLSIYAQIGIENIIELGRITEPINSFQWKTPLIFLKQIPTDKIIRYIFKIYVSLTCTQFIKLGFRCGTCGLEKTFNCGCKSAPKFEIQVRCMGSDGTEVTSLELRDE